MKELLIVLFCIAVLVAAFKFVDYEMGQAIKAAQLGALGL